MLQENIFYQIAAYPNKVDLIKISVVDTNINQINIYRFFVPFKIWKMQMIGCKQGAETKSGYFQYNDQHQYIENQVKHKKHNISI